MNRTQLWPPVYKFHKHAPLSLSYWEESHPETLYKEESKEENGIQ